eukprot:3687483-Karenia_brevis.AAC.1
MAKISSTAFKSSHLAKIIAHGSLGGRALLGCMVNLLVSTTQGFLEALMGSKSLAVAMIERRNQAASVDAWRTG